MYQSQNKEVEMKKIILYTLVILSLASLMSAQTGNTLTITSVDEDKFASWGMTEYCWDYQGTLGCSAIDKDKDTRENLEEVIKIDLMRVLAMPQLATPQQATTPASVTVGETFVV